MKTQHVTVKVKKEFEGLYVGEEVTAILAEVGEKKLYHIATRPLSMKVFKEHFEII